MNINDEQFKYWLEQYQLAVTGTTQETRAFNYIYPTIITALNKAIKSTQLYSYRHIQDIEDSKQIVLMKSLCRLKYRIIPKDIRNVNSLMFVLYNNLCRNEIQRLLTLKKKQDIVQEVESEVYHMMNYITDKENVRLSLYIYTDDSEEEEVQSLLDREQEESIW